jgi:hypothetical protein
VYCLNTYNIRYDESCSIGVLVTSSSALLLCRQQCSGFRPGITNPMHRPKWSTFRRQNRSKESWEEQHLFHYILFIRGRRSSSAKKKPFPNQCHRQSGADIGLYASADSNTSVAILVEGEQMIQQNQFRQPRINNALTRVLEQHQHQQHSVR